MLVLVKKQGRPENLTEFEDQALKAVNDDLRKRGERPVRFDRTTLRKLSHQIGLEGKPGRKPKTK
jgi:hypothetical protein